MVSFALFALIASAALAVSFRKLFAGRGNWLPVTLSAVLPPLLFIPYALFGMLRDIGASAEASGHAPPHMVDDFATGLELSVARGVIWLVVAVPVSIAVLRWFGGRSSK